MDTRLNKTRSNQPIVVAALYHFATLPDPKAVQEPLLETCRSLGIKGTLLLAREGINGTIAGSRSAIDNVLAHIRSIPGLACLEHKESGADEMPFRRMKVRLKKEIVTMGVEGIDPNHIVGTYVDPKDWNALISDPDTVLIDTRNDYETAVGIFRNAVDPKTRTFREFPEWVANSGLEPGKQKIAMYCTGGIRCEKATAFMREKGFPEVYHLKGGILKYLETVPEDESLWEGNCFVFDERVSVGHGLVASGETLCRACRHPLTEEDRASDVYEEGVSCPHCHATRSDEDRARYRMRHLQMLQARQTNESEI